MPREVFTHPASHATAAELRWLLEHPSELEHVYFVFGAYNALPQPAYDELSRTFADGDKESEALRLMFEELHKRRASQP